MPGQRQFRTELYDGDCERYDCLVSYYHEPGEPQTWDYPGSPEMIVDPHVERVLSGEYMDEDGDWQIITRPDLLESCRNDLNDRLDAAGEFENAVIEKCWGHHANC